MNRYIRKGFTLIELMVVIVVVAILATISIVTYTSVQDRAHTAATLTNIRAYVNALEMLEVKEGIFVGAGCIGGSTDANELCSWKSHYVGSGCADTTTIYGTERNLEFDAKMKQYLGDLPEQVLSKPYTASAVAGENCTLTTTQNSALYQSYKSLTVLRDSSVDIVFSVSHPQTNNQAWAITFMLPDANAECPLPNSYKLPTVTDDITSCAVVGGNVTYE